MKNKFKVKSLNSGTLSKALTAGVLACVLSCGAVMPKMAEAKTLIADNTQQYSYVGNTGGPLNYIIPGMSVNGKVDVIKLANNFHLFDPDRPYGTRGYTDKIFVHTDISGNVRYFASAAYEGYSGGDNEITYYKTYELTESEVNAALGSGANVSALIGNGGTSYTADNGINISSDNKVSVKPGTNVTVDGNGVSVTGNGTVTSNNGVSVTGNGTVTSNNAGLISGGTAYNELRSSANGNYVKTTNTTGANLKVLDDKIGAESVANGTYIKTENTVNANLKALDLQIGALNEDGEYIQKNNNVSQNLAALDNAIDDVVNSGLQFGANSGDDVTNKIGSKVSIIGGGTKADNEYDSKNIKTIIVQDENGNTQIEIDLDKNPEFASILTEGDANIGGKLNVDGDTHLKSNLQVDGDTNISGNTTIEKDLTVKGDSNLEGNAHVYQNLQVDGDTNISGNTTIEKNLTMGMAAMVEI